MIMNYARLNIGVGLAAMACCLAAPAIAQNADNADNKSASDDIIVTATRRADSIQKVPVSVTAVTARAIERIGAKDLEDLARTVPSLVVTQNDEQADKSFVIRGIGNATESDATVAVYLDDTPITFGSSSPDLKLFDVSQVEILRGPQGTLFGSSSMGGAIRYTSPTPSTDRLNGMLRGEFSILKDGAPSYEGQAAVSGPLAGDKLAFRASGFYRRDGGYIDLRDENTGAILKKDYDNKASYGGRVALRTELSPTINATLSAIYQKLDGDGISTFFSGRGVTDTIALPPLSRVDRADARRTDKVFLPNLTVNIGIGSATLTSSSSYIKRDVTVFSDFSYYVQKALGIPDPTDFFAQNIERRHFSGFVQEVRLASANSGPFRWIAGGYFRSTNEQMPQSVLTNLATVAPPLAPALLANGSIYERTIDTDRTQFAAFGEGSYTLFDKLTLTAGVRWTELKQQVHSTANGLIVGGFSESRLRSNEQPITPKFSAKYQITPRAMVYATAAKGFREGGPNRPVPLGLASCVDALRSLGLTKAPDSFKTDTVWSYEVGTKFETADRRVRLAAAAYRIDWSGIQETINLTGGCGFAYVANIGQARSQGFELETTLRPGGGFSLDIAAGYTDARLTQDLVSGTDAFNRPVVAAPRGTKLPNIPDWTVRIAPQVDFGVGGGWTGFAHGELQYIGKVKRTLNTPTDDPRVLDRSDYALVNLRFGLANGPNEVNLFVNNLFDDGTLIYQSYQNFAPGTAFEATRVKPRVIGVSYKRNF